MVSQLQKSKKDLETYVAQLDGQLDDLENKIEDLKEEITAKKTEIEETKADIEQEMCIRDRRRSAKLLTDWKLPGRKISTWRCTI